MTKMTCCKCNRMGRCQNCVCVKRGQPCQNCHPQRLGNCANPVQVVPLPTAPNDMPVQPPIVPNTQPANLMPESPSHSRQPPARGCLAEPELPQFITPADPVFSWGEYDCSTFVNSLNAAFNEAVHWRTNLFKVPHGNAGKSFVTELVRLFNAFTSKSALETIALKAATLMPIRP